MKKLNQQHVIYILLVVVVSIPLLRPVGIPLSISPGVRNVYEFVEALPKDSVVMMSFDVTPAGFAESGPGTLAMLKHLFSKDIKVVAVAFSDTGPQIFENAIKTIDPQNKKYGEDYCNLGFRAGGEASIAALATDIIKTFPRDYKGNVTSSLPMMTNVKSAKDVRLVIDVYSNSPGAQERIRQFTDPNKVPFSVVSTANMQPQMSPFVQSKQAIGLISGLRSGAEYELLTKNIGVAVAGMDAQSFVHVLTIALIIYGNVLYWHGKKTGQGGAAK